MFETKGTARVSVGSCPVRMYTISVSVSDFFEKINCNSRQFDHIYVLFFFFFDLESSCFLQFAVRTVYHTHVMHGQVV